MGTNAGVGNYNQQEKLRRYVRLTVEGHKVLTSLEFTGLLLCILLLVRSDREGYRDCT